MDWNIFFSTVSQTCGAVVGIFSAFLITKIIADQAEFNKANDELSKLILDSKYISRLFLNCKFEQYNSMMLSKELELLLEKLKEEESFDDPAVYLNAIQPSSYQDKSEVLEGIRKTISKAKEHIRKEEEKIRKAESRKARTEFLREQFGDIVAGAMLATERNDDELSMPQMFSNMRNNYYSTDSQESIDNLFLAKQKVKIDDCLIKASHQMDVNSKYLTQLKRPNDARKLVSTALVAVVILFYLGVIYPLSFLPLPADEEIKLSFIAFFKILFSLKGGLLALLTITFSTLIYVFWLANSKLKFTVEEIKELERYSKPEGYCRYLSNYYKNTDLQGK